jgi:hypothetical protein
MRQAIAHTACAAMLAAALALHGCAQPQPAAQTAQTDMPAEAVDADGTGGAVATAPVARWLGRALLQLITNTNVDIKVEHKGAP